MLTAITSYHPAAVIAVACLLILGVWAVVDFYLATQDKRDHEQIRDQINNAYRSFKNGKSDSV